MLIIKSSLLIFPSFLVLISLLLSTSINAQTETTSCANHKFSNNNFFKSCDDLPYHNSYLHWTYHPANATVQIAYRHTAVTGDRWVAWAINPVSSKMLGSQCLVGYHMANGSVGAYTSPVTSYDTSLQEGKLSFNVSDTSAVYNATNGEMIIFATLELPSNSTKVNQVWQDGPLSSKGVPQEHSMTRSNKRSVGTIDFLSEGLDLGASGSEESEDLKKNIHGVLNAISWGILMPIGIIIARYMRVFPSADPTWFYLHISCQVSAYIIGVSGWVTGLGLGDDDSEGSDSEGSDSETHGHIGLALFILGLNQMFALLLRPKKDHKYRLYWNIYHHAVGYTIAVLGIVNVFKGLKLLEPEQKWKNAYIGIIVALGCVAMVLEGITWYVVLKRKKQPLKPPHDQIQKPNTGVAEVEAYGSNRA